MDTLELGVGDGGLRQGGKVLSPEEDDEVVDVGGDLIGGRRDVDGAAGRVVGAADPVLDAAQTTDLFVDVGRERRQEGSVGREEIIRFEVAPVRDAAECAGRVPRGGDEAGEATISPRMRRSAIGARTVPPRVEAPSNRASASEASSTARWTDSPSAGVQWAMRGATAAR